MIRAFTIVFLADVLLSAATSTEVRTLLETNCVGCHNRQTKSGDLDLKTRLMAQNTFVHDREIWEKVLEKLQTKQMPPPALPQPSATLVSNATAWLEEEFARQDRLIKPQAGRIAARRLNRAEYNNTIGDLLGIDIRP